ncbi:TIGR03087 family PEP-CTERM/XrtA system glycosyltransferase [Novosphingopyxis sp.]|uniref:TIGR03087 family PEP-CTERM/XrtA system glycosyltransferase n=1 Tax=Novosphingopyxis sp. TaxID=2709690 RepID=UPI003B5ABDD1
MSVLFVAHRMPWPPDRGDKIRSYHMLRWIAERAPVHVAAFVDQLDDWQYREALEAVTVSTILEPRIRPMWKAGVRALAAHRPVSLAAFDSPTMRRKIDRLVKREGIETIHIFSSQMAQYIPKSYRGRVVMDFGDVDSAKFERYGVEGSGPMAWINRREGRLLAGFEASVADRADASLFVSEAEAALFRARSGAERVQAVGNGIDLERFDPQNPDIAPLERRPDGPLIVFTGQMDYRPNIEAARSFAATAMPIIRAGFPDAHFAIVGRAPTAELRSLDKDGVFVTGEVPDTRSWLAAADLVVAPLRIARGVQNKVLEAMAMARPVLASAAAFEGIDAVAGEHLTVAETPEQEARMACQLLADPIRRGALGRAARAHVAAHYRWDARLAPLGPILGLPDAPAMAAAE